MTKRIKDYLEQKRNKTAEEYQLLALLASGVSLETVREFRSDLMETADKAERESR